MSTLKDAQEMSVFGNPCDAGARAWMRRRERRTDLRQVIAALVAGLSVRRDEGALQNVFEQEMSRIVPARSVRLREVATRYQARLVTPTRTARSVVLDVPTFDPARQVVLEATFESGSAMDEWNVELLNAAAQLGALVIEAESRRGPIAATPPFDGAAPLIGSTIEMQVLRDRVERVACTDFTVLVEGPTGR